MSILCATALAGCASVDAPDTSAAAELRSFEAEDHLGTPHDVVVRGRHELANGLAFALEVDGLPYRVELRREERGSVLEATTDLGETLALVELSDDGEIVLHNERGTVLSNTGELTRCELLDEAFEPVTVMLVSSVVIGELTAIAPDEQPELDAEVDAEVGAEVGAQRAALTRTRQTDSQQPTASFIGVQVSFSCSGSSCSSENGKQSCCCAVNWTCVRTHHMCFCRPPGGSCNNCSGPQDLTTGRGHD